MHPSKNALALALFGTIVMVPGAVVASSDAQTNLDPNNHAEQDKSSASSYRVTSRFRDLVQKGEDIVQMGSNLVQKGGDLLRGKGKGLRGAKEGDAVVDAGAQTTTSRKLGGCYPAYVDGGAYGVGTMVSSTVTATSNPVYTMDPVSGLWNVKTTTTTTSHNYKCISNNWCGNTSYGPGAGGESLAWEKENSECKGTATPIVPAGPPIWYGTGCPAGYSPSTKYDAGDVVTGGDDGLVYRCLAEPKSLFCKMVGYEPGSSIYWDNAWEMLGSCTGTLSPTGSPVYQSLPDVGGCPAVYKGGASYKEKDRVSDDNGIVYQCKEYPVSQHCSQAGFEPNRDVATPGAWKIAWAVVGHCEGTIAPTSSPNYVSLANWGGCPPEFGTPQSYGAYGKGTPGFGSTVQGSSSWSWGIHTTYEPGDVVSVNGMVFKCKPWPYSGHCSQQGYEPTTDPTLHDNYPGADGTTLQGAWRFAWDIVGHCSGSVAPTSSPIFVKLKDMGACPAAYRPPGSTASSSWTWGIHTTYEEGDMVSKNGFVFACKAWPFSNHCSQEGYEPLTQPTLHDNYPGSDGTLDGAWRFAWDLVGYCSGTASVVTTPTSSPIFDTLDLVGGCPGEWSAGDTSKYQADDRVSVTVSASPQRTIVYACMGWPYQPLCGQHSPTAHGGAMAWRLLGHCDGTVEPTPSPIYCGIYQQCRTVGGVNQCTAKDAEPYSSSFTYHEGDVIRVGGARFKCKSHPTTGWCSNGAYLPNSDLSGIWTSAWDTDGLCP